MNRCLQLIGQIQFTIIQQKPLHLTCRRSITFSKLFIHLVPTLVVPHSCPKPNSPITHFLTSKIKLYKELWQNNGQVIKILKLSQGLLSLLLTLCCVVLV